MEAYFTKIRRPTKNASTATLKQEPKLAATEAEITRRLLDTLTDARNPITHSDLRDRSGRLLSSRRPSERPDMVCRQNNIPR